MSTSIKLIGILNVTPDSFTDGGEFLSYEHAIAHAEAMIRAGADIIDIGGDSTRPGSRCTGPDEEWRRIERIIKALASRCMVSVDTHHATVAREALSAGAKMINDVTAGSDPEMFSAVANAGASLILMYSRCSKPHSFDKEPTGDIVERAKEFLVQRAERAIAAGVDRDKIILDPGMGGFISESPQVSWNVISRFDEFEDLGFPLCFASSRKGFLRTQHENSAKDRDSASALTAVMAKHRCPQGLRYVRTHNVALQKEFFAVAERIEGGKVKSDKGDL